MRERLTDQLDIASELEQKAANIAIDAAHEAAKKPEVEATGSCLFCGEDFPKDDTRRFCDANCRDDWQMYVKHRK